jgi:hypothetical protein
MAFESNEISVRRHQRNMLMERRLPGLLETGFRCAKTAQAAVAMAISMLKELKSRI